jgi:hypothetical protein
MQAVVETSLFARRAEGLLSAGERMELINFLAANPLAGDLIGGSGGVRKVRFAVGARGKSGGVRVIYYYLNQGIPIYAMLIYAKNEQANVTPDQLRRIVEIVVQTKSGMKGAGDD